MIFEFRNETRAVVRAALGEACGGFAANRFPWEERPHAERLFQKVDSNVAITLSEEEAALCARALDFALQELDPDEFSTVTGYDFDFGWETLRQIKSALADPKSN